MIMVGIGVMGLGGVERLGGVKEGRAVSGQEGFWIEELCNRDSHDSRR